MRSIAACGVAGLPLVASVASVAVVAAPAPASHVVREREITITHVHLGLTPGGRVGVYVAITPRRPRSLTTAGVAVGSRPRMVFGFYDEAGLVSPLRDPFPNASRLRVGRSYRVSISFCRVRASAGAPAPGRALEVTRSTGEAPARAAKRSCATRSFVTTHAVLKRRFSPPA